MIDSGTWLHGEAVSAGIVMAADLSYRLGWIERSIFDRTKRLLERCELPVAAPQVRKPAKIFAILLHRGLTADAMMT